jgi:hypothetical protein
MSFAKTEGYMCGSPLHLGGHNSSAQQLSTDGNVSSPGALLVDVNTVLGLNRCLEAKTNGLDHAGGETTSQERDFALRSVPCMQAHNFQTAFLVCYIGQENVGL